MFIFGLIVGVVLCIIIKMAMVNKIRHFIYFMLSKKVGGGSHLYNKKYSYIHKYRKISIYEYGNESFSICDWHQDVDKYIYNNVVDYFI